MGFERFAPQCEFRQRACGVLLHSGYQYMMQLSFERSLQQLVSRRDVWRGVLPSLTTT